MLTIYLKQKKRRIVTVLYPRWYLRYVVNNYSELLQSNDNYA